MANKREHSRIKVDLDVEYHVPEDSVTYQTPTGDLSHGGMQFQSHTPLEVGAKMDIALFGFSQIPVVVRHCTPTEEGYEVGVAFVQLPEDVRLILDQMQRLDFMI